MKINYKPKGLVPETVNGMKVGDYCMGPGPGVYQILAMKPMLLGEAEYANHPEYYDTRYSVPDLATGKWAQKPVKPGDLISVIFTVVQRYNGVGGKIKNKKTTLEAVFTNCYPVNIDGMVKNLEYDRDQAQKKVDLANKRIAALQAAKKEIDEDKNKAEVVSGHQSEPSRESHSLAEVGSDEGQGGNLPGDTGSEDQNA